MEKRKNRVIGSLIGGAVGDALGYPVEFCSYEAICGKYGRSGITRYDLSSNGKALISDDTQMTLFTANGILFGATRLALRGIAADPKDYINYAYLDWLRTQTTSYKSWQKADKEEVSVSWLLNEPELYSRRAPGMTCLSALEAIKDQTKPIGTIEKPINSSKGCGGVMRVAPCGLYGFVISAIVCVGADAAAITHGHALGYIPAGTFALLCHYAAYSDMPLNEAVAEAMKLTKNEFGKDRHWAEYESLMDQAVSLAANKNTDIENISELGGGWVAEEALAIAVYCALRYQDDFSSGVTAAVNHSGDSDSTGAICGNILGAYLGLDAISKSWKDSLELYDVIYTLGKDLASEIPVSGYDTREDRSKEENKEWLSKYVYKVYK